MEVRAILSGCIERYCLGGVVAVEVTNFAGLDGAFNAVVEQVVETSGQPRKTDGTAMLRRIARSLGAAGETGEDLVQCWTTGPGRKND